MQSELLVQGLVWTAAGHRWHMHVRSDKARSTDESLR